MVLPMPRRPQSSANVGFRTGPAPSSRRLSQSIRRFHPAIDSSAAAWCDRFPVIFNERDRLGANTQEELDMSNNVKENGLERITRNNSALCLIDHQVGLLVGVHDIAVAELKHNVVGL